jgi:acetylornithine/succinyldiaminopimelate/putrescine aminotransferase
MTMFEKLQQLRGCKGAIRTRGLADEEIRAFAEHDSSLGAAVDAAHAAWQQLRQDWPEFLDLDEDRQRVEAQLGFVNFYAADCVVPYVSLAARGPWVISVKGAVLYDCGGYGMLGFGHAPEFALEAMNGQQVMANIMTPNLSQRQLSDALRAEIGHRRDDTPFTDFVCLNSGSEAVTLAARISDINAKLQTDPGGNHACQTIKLLGLQGAFHGRTDRPAHFSDSTRKTYCKYLASFRDHDNLITVEPNNLEQLAQVFEYAESNRCFIEAFFLEPVMGEGNPGLSVTPEFYALARELTLKHGSVLLVDSIQAGLRAHGVLSMCDYPGFEQLPVPDMESYSKALNAGQFPLSVLALSPRASDLYRAGVYGNTMTSNPRAMDVAVAVLKQFTPQLRRNIVERGRELVDKLRALQKQMDGQITRVQGTGLLVSAELDGRRFKAYGEGSTEEYMRTQGINVIHGGATSLRYTPHFAMTSAEVDLLVEHTRQALQQGPAKALTSEAA